ncbi:MAG TPA: GntR family transcriptional regulator [Pseudonocardia sp.]|jgi:DNA-binding GntR family transcriptional regulator|uniref:GntR family transcriptional regulator n=1 Tax=Pseudonocardia sp. TaxID=60912 RepID=UPI002B96E711|nr:GntR family transcriptional regulator [Pseudonocardia sp.]HTF54286.1 GntR family transcriptional regulator [Pseudonocardia sp.]
MTSADRPLTRPVLREQLRERILQRILEGTYGPGARIVESHLMREYGVSQAPIREALRDLEAMRFVESEPHRGVRVRRISDKELGEMYPVRAALEEVAGRAAAPLITAETLGLLEGEIEAMRSAVHRDDLHAQLKHDARFHELIVEASGNSLLLEVWRSLHAEVRALITFARLHSSLMAIADAHQPILEALRLRDPNLAGKEMREHIEHFGALVMGDAL